MRRSVETCLCLEVRFAPKDFGALTHWLCRRFLAKSSRSVVPDNMDASFLSAVSHAPDLKYRCTCIKACKPK